MSRDCVNENQQSNLVVIVRLRRQQKSNETRIFYLFDATRTRTHTQSIPLYSVSFESSTRFVHIMIRREVQRLKTTASIVE